MTIGHQHKYRSITLEKADGTSVVFDLNDPGCEPVFLLRGQDQFAAKAVAYYSDLLQLAGHSELAEHAQEHANEMDTWPLKKVPD